MRRCELNSIFKCCSSEAYRFAYISVRRTGRIKYSMTLLPSHHTYQFLKID